jgi:hypothetical protein
MTMHVLSPHGSMALSDWVGRLHSSKRCAAPSNRPRDAAAAFTIEVPALQAWLFGPAELAAVRAPMLSIAHDDAWAGFLEVHCALVAAGAESALMPVRSYLLHVLDADAVAGAIDAFLLASVDQR